MTEGTYPGQMAEEPEVLAHLRAAVAADPDDLGLRLHLASALLGFDADEALSHAQRVLEIDPTHQSALSVAGDAAERTGRGDAAAGYRRLLDALGATPVAVPTESDLAPHVTDDVYDAFLREVLAEDARQRVTLDDVAGLADVKAHLEATFLGPMRRPELRDAFATSLRGGLLLYGPPGCGKTFLARAVAGELGARFVSVGLHDVLDMWLGSSERNLHGVFAEARRLAPCVLFLDEVDALGQKRSHLAHSAGRNVVVQLLTELDSMAADNEGVFVLAATNAPWDLDPALRRPGRLDRSLLVLPPDAEARAAVLATNLRDRPVASDVDTSAIAAATEGFSGADLRLVCDTAARGALARSAAAQSVAPITGEDLLDAVAGLRPSTLAWFDDARSHVLFANRDGQYDDLLRWMRQRGLA